MSVGRVLAIGVLTGRWTLENLDRRRADIQRQMERAATDRREPVTPHRNLAREWIDANQKKWCDLLEQHLDGPAAVVAAPAPREPAPPPIRRAPEAAEDDPTDRGVGW